MKIYNSDFFEDTIELNDFLLIPALFSLEVLFDLDFFLLSL